MDKDFEYDAGIYSLCSIGITRFRKLKNLFF